MEKKAWLTIWYLISKNDSANHYPTNHNQSFSLATTTQNTHCELTIHLPTPNHSAYHYKMPNSVVLAPVAKPIIFVMFFLYFRFHLAFTKTKI